MGLSALKKLEETTSGYFPGHLRDQFAHGGISEIMGLGLDSHETAQILSLDEFRQAEDRLGKAPLDMKEVDLSHILATGVLDHKHESHIIEYSRDDTKTEQAGDAAKSDADLSTAGGYLKRAIQDPDAHRKNRKRAQSDFRLMELMRQQDIELQRLEAQIALYDEKLKQIDIELAETQENIAELEELSELVDDLDANTPKGQRARTRIDQGLTARGLRREDFLKEDGTHDQERLARAFEKEIQEELERETRLEQDRAGVSEKREELTAQHNHLSDNRFTNSMPTLHEHSFSSNLETNVDKSNDFLNAEINHINSTGNEGFTTFSERSEEPGTGSFAMAGASLLTPKENDDIQLAELESTLSDNNLFDGLGEDAFTSFDSQQVTTFASLEINTEMVSFGEDEIVALEEDFDSAAFGSFASNSGEETVSITAQFHTKANPEEAQQIEVAALTAEQQQFNQITESTATFKV